MKHALRLLLASLAPMTLLVGQQDWAQIGGKVFDPAGASVAGARLTL
ncbi:MAG: hypothetical protein JNL62_22105, partial [Bryobacterales bacterium]|nr:hypothetical protein [Bryobacterales bacterium]